MAGKKFTLPQFRTALKRMDSDVRGRVLAKAALAGGYVIEAYAKINVTKTFTARTGNLLNSISTTLEKTTATSAKVSVGPTVIYGRIHELGGTIKPVHAKMLHWVDESGKHHQANSVTIPARPYLRPAIDENEKKILAAVGANLQIEIEGHFR